MSSGRSSVQLSQTVHASEDKSKRVCNAACLLSLTAFADPASLRSISRGDLATPSTPFPGQWRRLRRLPHRLADASSRRSVPVILGAATDRHSRPAREGCGELPHSVRPTRTPGAESQAPCVTRSQRVRVRTASTSRTSRQRGNPCCSPRTATTRSARNPVPASIAPSS